MTYLLLIIGFVALIKGADFFVDGSSNIAKVLGIPSIIIGLTIVSLGTSLPEAAVSVTASFEGSNALAISNVTGSNIFNLMLVAGVCTFIKPIVSETSTLKRDFPVATAAAVMVLLFILDGEISRIEAGIFLVSCAVYIYVLIKDALKSRKVEKASQEIEETEKKTAPMWRSVLFVFLGIPMIIVGGDLVVESATSIAQTFGLSETIIGLTIVAIGTSLPELVTSIVAARKGESELAMGNAIGSCILNILFILGLSAMVSPIAVESAALYHVGVMVATTLLMYWFALTDRVATKKEGFISALVYVGYMVTVVISA